MKTLRIALLTLLALALLLAGAASPSQALDVGGSQSRGSVAPAQPSSLTIGTLLPLTGVLSDFGLAMQNGADLAALHINASGGVLGLPIVLVHADTETDCTAAVSAAQDLIDTYAVDAIVGAVASGVTICVAEGVTVPNQMLLVSPASTSPGITTLADDDWVFRTVCSDVLQGEALAQLAWDLGYSTACTMYVDDPYGQGLSNAFTQAFQALGGTVQVQVPHGDTGPYLLQLQTCTAGGPDVLAAISYTNHAEVYLREALENVLIDQFIFTDGVKWQDMFDSLDDDHPDAFDGMYGTAPGSSFTPEFSTAYEAEYGPLPDTPFIAETYDAVVAIALAAERAGSTDTTAIRDALRGVACPPGSLIGAGAADVAAGLTLAAAAEHVDYEGGTDHQEFNEYGDATRGTVEIWKIDEFAQIVTDREEPVEAQPDADDDGFDVCVEVYLGTAFLDDCPDDPSDDAWPLDMNNDGLLNLGGDVSNYYGKIGCFVATNPECQRLDLNMDGLLNLGGDVINYYGMIGEICTNP